MSCPPEPHCATGYAAVGPPRVAELNERITRLTDLRDRLLDRMPWLAADASTAQRDEIPSTGQE